MGLNVRNAATHAKRPNPGRGAGHTFPRTTPSMVNAGSQGWLNPQDAEGAEGGVVSPPLSTVRLPFRERHSRERLS